MRIGLITTLGVNIGDDMIRLGVMHILSRIFAEQRLAWVPVNKHEPHTVWSGLHPYRWLPKGKRTARRLLKHLWSSRFHTCDLIVQCGTPGLWDGCQWCEWWLPLWRDVIGEIHRRIPVYNLGIGSDYRLDLPPRRIERSKDEAFLRELLSYCRLTTVRDSLARDLLSTLGYDVPLLVCPAVLAFGDSQADESRRDTIIVNYMRRGGHDDFGQNIDADRWLGVLRQVLGRMRQRYPLLLLCHNRAEMQLAETFFPGDQRLLAATPDDFRRAVTHGLVGLCNRLHASVAMAGLGVPSVAVSGDTRILMVKQAGLPCHSVHDCVPERLITDLEGLIARRDSEKRRLLALKSATLSEYITLMTAQFSAQSGL
jgi:hypothetical protein